MMPFPIPLDQAAAPNSILSFLSRSTGLFMLPMRVVHTPVVCRVFKETIDSAGHDE